MKGGEILALTGDLGSGKTTFIQGLAQGLGIENKIISPTFILLRHYDNLFHLDLYRLEGNVWQEVRNLGVEDYWGKEKNIFAIEWAEKIKKYLPKNTRWIKFRMLEDGKHEIIY